MMKRLHDARHLDVAQLAAEGATLSGEWPGQALDRLAPLQSPPQDLPLPPVDWQLIGERRAVAAGDDELWLTVRAQAKVWLTCQRCLQPMAWPLSLDRRIRFVRGEAAAEALDAEIEDDVLALTRTLDARELVEDELLLALPLVPRHEHCPQPLQVLPDVAETTSDAQERPNPFAVLQALKREGDPPR